MKIPGFDVYAFHNKPDVLYAIRDYDLKFPVGRARVVVELIVATGCPGARIKQKNPRGPSFLIINRSEGLIKPVCSTIARMFRDVLISRPTGDVLEGCAELVGDISSVFGKVALPAGDVLARIPVVLANGIEFVTLEKKVKKVKRANFELRPQGFGYVFATEEGLTRMLEKFEERIKKIESGQ